MASRATRSLPAFIALCLLISAAQEARGADACAVEPASPLVVNVKDKGAKGDGEANDTAAIQKAIDEVAGSGGTVYVPNGTYLVGTTGKKRLQLRSKMTLKLAERAVLKAIPNGSKSYTVLRIRDAADVAVVGGTLHGDRKEHKGKAGEWGMGIYIGPEAKRITVAGVTAKDMWGDGFYVNGARDVAFCSVAGIFNRRQGLSIVEADGVLVTGSLFRDTKGTRPSAGIDLEPNRPENRIKNVRIERSKFIANDGGGIMIAGKKGEVSKVAIIGNVFEGNRPILVENAPKVRSTQICENRYIGREEPTSAGFASYAEPVPIVALQSNCSEGRDLRFEKNRITKKKK